MAKSLSFPTVDERELQTTQSSEVHDIIRDSDNEKSCHQCRQKIKSLTVNCKNLKGNIRRKQCLIRICGKCLLNRYGEKVSEVELLDDWKCPKCRGICNCNCSVCMKKKGEKPTGQLVKTAKESGFASVSHMLINQENNENSEAAYTDMVVGSPSQHASKEIMISENTADNNKISGVNDDKVEITDARSNDKPSSKSQRVKKYPTQLQDEEIPLPQGGRLTTVAGVEISLQDVGDALQFLEYCATFEEVFHMKKEQANLILKELMCGRRIREGQFALVIQFHFQLSSLILKDFGEMLPSSSAKDFWWDALKKCIMKSKFTYHKIPSDIFRNGEEGYERLNGSMKLKLLNVLCDEALCTATIRIWIDNQKSRFLEMTTIAKHNIHAAKEKEKTIMQQLKDVKGSTVPEHGDDVLKVKDELAEARREIAEAKDVFKKSKKRPAALRTESILAENDYVFWRLKGYDAEPNILLQELGVADDIAVIEEKWFAFRVEQEPTLEKYISSRKKTTSGLRRDYRDMTIREGPTTNNDHDSEEESTTKENKQRAGNQ